VDGNASIGSDVQIGPYSVIGPNVVLGDRTSVMSHVVIDGRTTLGPACSVFPFASIGTQTQDLKFRGEKTRVEIGGGTTIREYVTINSATSEGQVTRVGSRCFIMAYCHVAHACDVADEVIMANAATLAGHVIVEERAIIGGMSAVHQFSRVGTMCMIGGCSRISQDCPPYMMIVGNPAEVVGPNSVGLRRRGVSAETRLHLKEAHRLLWRKGLATGEGVRQVREQIPSSPEIERLLNFIEKSERGIIR
jgi:UDP-N-acetylglucosamine acyltransferase